MISHSLGQGVFALIFALVSKVSRGVGKKNLNMDNKFTKSRKGSIG